MHHLRCHSTHQPVLLLLDSPNQYTLREQALAYARNAVSPQIPSTAVEQIQQGAIPKGIVQLLITVNVRLVSRNADLPRRKPCFPRHWLKQIMPWSWMGDRTSKVQFLPTEMRVICSDRSWSGALAMTIEGSWKRLYVVFGFSEYFRWLTMIVAKHLQKPHCRA